MKREFKNIPYNELSKSDYNRPVDGKRVKDIVDNFKWDEVRPVIVSYREIGRA